MGNLVVVGGRYGLTTRPPPLPKLVFNSLDERRRKRGPNGGGGGPAWLAVLGGAIYWSLCLAVGSFFSFAFQHTLILSF